MGELKAPRSYRFNYQPPSREQTQRREFWRKLTVRCILADVKHKKPVDADLVEWAKAQVLGTTTKW